jgi:hypothetical protein
MALFEIIVHGRRLRDSGKKLAEIEESISRAEAKGEHTRAYALLHMAGRMAAMNRDYSSACAYYLRGASCGTESSSAFRAGWSYRMAAQCYFDSGDFRNAILHALEAASRFQKAGSIYAAQWSYCLAARAAEGRHDYHSAIRHYSMANSIVMDGEIEGRMDALKKKVPHPVIDYWASSEEVKEGECVKFELNVENHSPDAISNIKVIDAGGKAVETIEKLYPGEFRIIQSIETGSGSEMKSIWRKIAWDTGGETIEERLRVLRALVVPNVRTSVRIEPRLRMGRSSDFIFMVKNLSSSPLRDVTLCIKFPEEVNVTSKGPADFASIGRGEEKGAVFELVPVSVGEMMIRNATVSYTGMDGRKFCQTVNPIVLRESLSEPMEMPQCATEEIVKKIGEEGFKKLERARQKKRCLENAIVPFPMHEQNYVHMAASLFSLHGGFTLSGVSPDDIAEHVLEECAMFHLSAIHKTKREKLMMFSGKAAAEERTYLLTVGIKAREKVIDLLFSAYSEKEDGLREILNNISELLKYVIVVMNSAREVEKIEVNEVINIIDSIVQRSQIGAQGELRDGAVTIKDSIVQRSQGLHAGDITHKAAAGK